MSCNNPLCRTGHRHRSASSAFSLVEIMVVLVIIGLLAGLVTVNVRSRLIIAKQNAARSELATIRDAIDTFYTVHGRYPSNDEGLEILMQATDKISEPLLSHVPRDPWEHHYQYNSPGRNAPYEIISYGADGKEGGEGADQDITSAPAPAPGSAPGS